MRGLIGMNGRILLDTNIIIALLNDEKWAKEKLKESKEVFTSVITIGELFYGAYKSKKKEENFKKIDNFARQVGLLKCDLQTARYYGEIKNRLREKGQPIPENDIWVGATCIQYNLPLVSRDEHFDSIEDLSVEKW